MNPIIYALEEPVGAFADFAILCLFASFLVLSSYVFWGNVVAIYDQYDRGGWDIADPPLGWIIRVAAIPLVTGIDAAILSAMFYMLG